MCLEEWITNHLILKIGAVCSDYLYTEIIVDNPTELVEAVAEGDCYIAEILWWDRVRIDDCSPIGTGGPRDPRAPQKYYFAETFLAREFGSNTTKAEYLEYLQKTKSDHPDRDLFPGFDIALNIDN